MYCHFGATITDIMWIYYTLGSIVFFTLLNLLQRKLSVDSKNPRAMSVIFNSFAAIAAILLFFTTNSYSNFKLPSSPASWLLVVCVTFLYASYERGRFYVAKTIDASVFSTIMNIGLLVSFIGSIIFFAEAVTVFKIIGAVLILTALLLVSYSKHKSKSSGKGLMVGVLISIIIGFAWLFDKKSSEYFNADTYNIFVWTLPIVFIYLPYIKFADLKEEFIRGSWKLALLAVINVVGYFFQLKALALYEASRVLSLISTTTILTVLFGIVILNEKENALKKVIAGILAVIGIFFLI
jgi:drug/metabolite transporter (DMT)-like permease